jgi:hypothetical protein
VREPHYAVPPWAWRDAPVDREIHWRVLARLPSEQREVLRGCLPAEV